MDFKPDIAKAIMEYFIERADLPIVGLTRDLRIHQYNGAFERLIDSPTYISNEFFEDIVGAIEISTLPIVEGDYSLREVRCNYRSESGSVTHLKGSLIEREDETVIVFNNLFLSESKIISEISQMNVEMSNLTRELAKKNFELKRANERITEMLNTDFLTGLANRRIFFERLEELISLKRRRDNFEIGIIYMDIDFFKKINDTYGHNAGDLVLIEFSRMLKDNLRREDIVARIGGEEFCIIVQCSEEEYLFSISEKLRRKCESIELEDIDDRITACFGATLYRRWEDISTLMKRADRNMYEAKSSGRNQVIFK